MEPTLADWLVGILLLVLGVSHIVHSRLWSEFFVDLMAKQYAAFWIAMFTFPVGFLIVLTHNRWEWSPLVIVTVAGWGWSAKSLLYLLAPGVPFRVAAQRIGEPRLFVRGGVVATLMGIVVLTSCIAAAIK
jgi:hypothetical protein